MYLVKDTTPPLLLKINTHAHIQFSTLYLELIGIIAISTVLKLICCMYIQKLDKRCESHVMFMAMGDKKLEGVS